LTITDTLGGTVNAQNIQTFTNTVGSAVDTVNLLSSYAGTVAFNNIYTIVGSSGNDTLTDTIALAPRDSQTYSVNGGNGNDSITTDFTSTAGTAAIGAFTVYAVGGAGNDTITVKMFEGTSATATQYNIVDGGAGADTITIGTYGAHATAGATTLTTIVAENLSLFTAGDVNLADADQVTGFIQAQATAQHGKDVLNADKINLTGVTLTSSNGNTIASSTDIGSSGGTNYSAVFVSDTSANLASFGGSNAGKDIFNITDAATTASFTAQAGITAAVTFITTSVGTSGNGANQNAVIAVNNGTDTALFHYVEGATPTAGIQASELTLIGVLHGNATGLVAGNFS
jgi:hypothetical protein